MSCSSDREFCRETYFLVYVGVLEAASPADMSKETPEGQLGVARKRGSVRVGVPLAHLPALGCSSVDSFSCGFKGSFLFPAALLQVVPENTSRIIFSWMDFAELEGSAGAEVSSPPLGLCRLLVAGALAQFHPGLPQLDHSHPTP